MRSPNAPMSLRHIRKFCPIQIRSKSPMRAVSVIPVRGRPFPACSMWISHRRRSVLPPSSCESAVCYARAHAHVFKSIGCVQRGRATSGRSPSPPDVMGEAHILKPGAKAEGWRDTEQQSLAAREQYGLAVLQRHPVAVWRTVGLELAPH